MATQYTAGLTTQVLTSAIMNSIGATWETWTPTVTASAGTITSATVTLARYARIQNIVWVTFGYSVSNNRPIILSNEQRSVRQCMALTKLLTLYLRSM